MSATMTSPWPTSMFDPNPWWPWPPQGVIPLPVPVLLGGTGATTAAGVMETLGVNQAITTALQPIITAMLPDAPRNTNVYGRQNGAWVVVTGDDITLPLAIADGGTGAVTAAAALTALGGVPLATAATITGNLTVGAAANFTSLGTLNIDGPLFVTDGTTLQPVTIGAADTGDTGFRVLQVPN